MTHDDRRHNLGQWVKRLSGRALDSIDLLFREHEKPLSEGQIVVDADRMVYIAGLIDNESKVAAAFDLAAIPTYAESISFGTPKLLERRYTKSGGTGTLAIDFDVGATDTVALEFLHVRTENLGSARNINSTLLTVNDNTLGRFHGNVSTADGSRLHLPDVWDTDSAPADDNQLAWVIGDLLLHNGSYWSVIGASFLNTEALDITIAYRSRDNVALLETVTGGTGAAIP